MTSARGTGRFESAARGARLGLGVAVVLILLAALVYAFGGDAVEAKYNMSLLEVASSYAIGCPISGLVFGLLSPVAHSAIRGFFVGTAVVLPSMLIISAFMMPRHEWIPPGLVIAILASMLFGGGLGAVWASESK